MRGFRLLLLLLAAPAFAQPLEPADSPVRVMPFEEWQTLVTSSDTSQRAAAWDAELSLSPEDVAGFDVLLLQPDVEIRQAAEHALEGQSLRQPAEDAQPWAEALLLLDASLAAKLPAAPPASAEGAPLVPSADATPQRDDSQLATIMSARRHLVYCLGLCLPPDKWNLLEPHYGVVALRPDVLEAWLRIRGTGWRSFMDTKLLSRGEAELLDLIPVYAKAFGPDATHALAQVAQGTQSAAVFWAAVDALSREGVAPGQIAKPRPDYTPEQSRDFARFTLRAAQWQSEHGHCDQAESVYLDVVERNIGPWGVRAALEGLAQCNYAELHRVAVGYVNDPALRQPIIAMLSRHLSPDGEKALRSAWPQLPPLSQSAVLQVLHARDAAAAAPLLKEARASQFAGVRYQAALLMGENPSEEDLWLLANAEPAWLQAEALQGYLALAEARLARGESEAARRQYLLLLQGGMPVAIEQAAIAGLGRVGNPEDKPILEQLASEKPLRDVSENAMVSLVSRAGSVEERAAAVARLSAKEVPQAEMDALVAEVSDPEARAGMLLRAGFFAEGKVAGPMSMAAQSGMQQLHFPVSPSAIAQPARYSGQEFPWQPVEACAAGCAFDVAQCLAVPANAKEICAYLVFDVSVPVLSGVYLFVNNDDGFALFVGGKFVHAEEAPADGNSRWTRVPVVLLAGRSEIVVKLAQGHGSFMGGLRITTRDGKPVDLTQQEMPPDPVKPVGLGAKSVQKMMENLP